MRQSVCLLKNRYLKASFTIEASIVMAIIFFALACGILCAFYLRDKLVTRFITHAAAVDGACSEAEWLENEEILREVEDRAKRRMHAIGALSSQEIEVTRQEGTLFLSGRSVAVTSDGIDTEISSRIFDPENILRVRAIISDWKDKEKNSREAENGS